MKVRSWLRMPMMTFDPPGDGGGAGGGDGTGTPPAGDTTPPGDGKPAGTETPPGKKGDEDKLSNAEAAELRKLRKEKEEREKAEAERKAAEMSEVEKRDARIAELEKADREKTRKLIGAELGLDPKLWGRIQGDDEDAMRADAADLLAVFGTAKKNETPPPGSTGGDPTAQQKPPAPGNPEIEKLEAERKEAINKGDSLAVLTIDDKLRKLKAKG